MVYLTNTCSAYWLDINSLLNNSHCLFICKCTVVPAVPDFRVACILSSLNCQLLNLRFHQRILCYSLSANCEQNVMDIRKYLGKRTQKEQSDKSSGEESDTEELLCRADKSKTFMTCPVSNKLSAQQKKKCYKKKRSYKKVWEKVHPWVQCEDPKVGMFCTLCKKWGRPPPSAKGGGGQGELLTGTMP